jgi:hypothetical protein
MGKTYLERFEDLSFMLMNPAKPKGYPLRVVPIEVLKPLAQLLAKLENTLEAQTEGHVIPRKATLARKALDELRKWKEVEDLD